MQQVTVYHNPRCSKSRKALEILKDKGLKLNIIEYLVKPLTLEQLTKLRSYFKLEDFVRSNERCFKELKLSLQNETQILQAMVKEPRLMQRPIIIFTDKAIIGRSPEKILELFS